MRGVGREFLFSRPPRLTPFCVAASLPGPICPRSFPTTATALKKLEHVLSLARILALAPGSPPFALAALVAAGVVPPLVAVLGRWEGFKAAAPVATQDPLKVHWLHFVLGLARLIAGLAARSPAARRQLRDGGAAPLLLAIAADPALAPTAVPGLCRYALRYLGAV